MAAKGKDEKQTAAEFGLLRAYLAKIGVTQAQINAAIGKTANKRTRAQIVDMLRAWLKDLPKV